MTLLYATPLYVLLTLLLAGGIAAWTGNQRQKPTMRNVGLGLIALAVVLLTVSFLVETDLEKVKRLNKELVQAVPNRNWPKFADLLDPDATLGTVETTIFGNRDKLVQGAKAAAEQWGVTSATITGTDETQDASKDVTIDINVLTKQDKTDGVLPGTLSSWRMVWSPTGKEWHCRQIICLKIGNEQGGHVEKFIH